ncbi:tail fiber protein/ lysozyme [Vibrio phage CP-T1]|uniref:tail fiber protein/ lysozyme n=1 Tax=Vibrio phage CP-T1 TaxID=10689 RepID=UPI0002536CF1|nr:tail fiber protein/ lysozyme [Vibrio phage CP-T1]AFC22438.1 putative tail-fiber/lysozyme protein [Vibrio phage CP-T1]
MATTITNFLVGLGMDTTEFDKGQRNVTSGLDSMRSKALQLGALAGGAFGAKALTFGFAEAADNIGKFSEVFSVIPDDIRAMGAALAQEGGSLESFMAQIETLERLRASTPQQIGALFAEAGIRGVDPSVILSAKSATDAYLALADVFDDLTAKQRLAVAPVFGLDEASIRLLSKGRQEVESMVERQRDIRPLTTQMTEEAGRFNRQWKDIQNNIGSIADQISVGILPPLTDLVGELDDWVDANKELINSGINDFTAVFADNIHEIAIAGGILATGGLLTGLAGMAKYVPLIGGGLATAAMAARTITGIGAAGMAAYVGADIVDEKLRENISGYDEWDAKVTRYIYDITGIDLSRGNVNEGTERSTGSTKRYSSDEMDTMARDMMTRLPTIEPTLFSSGMVAPQTQRNSQPAPQNDRPIQINMILDGQVLDSRIIDVTSRMDETTIDELSSSTAR